MMHDTMSTHIAPSHQGEFAWASGTYQSNKVSQQKKRRNEIQRWTGSIHWKQLRPLTWSAIGVL